MKKFVEEKRIEEEKERKARVDPKKEHEKAHRVACN